MLDRIGHSLDAMSDWSPHPPPVPPPGGQAAGWTPGPPPAEPAYWASPPTPHPVRASFGARLAAFLLDGLVATGLIVLILVPAIVAGFIFSNLTEGTCTDAGGFTGPCDVPTAGTVVLWIALALMVIVGYFAVVFFVFIRPVAKTGQTIGRRAMKIRVVHAQTGALLSLGAAIGRWAFAYFISSQIFYIGYLWMLWDENEQTLHDKVVKSVVVPTG